MWIEYMEKLSRITSKNYEMDFKSFLWSHFYLFYWFSII